MRLLIIACNRSLINYLFIKKSSAIRKRCVCSANMSPVIIHESASREILFSSLRNGYRSSSTDCGVVVIRSIPIVVFLCCWFIKNPFINKSKRSEGLIPVHDLKHAFSPKSDALYSKEKHSVRFSEITGCFRMILYTNDMPDAIRIINHTVKWPFRYFTYDLKEDIIFERSKDA
jgi:hypothetical protein